MITRHLMIIFVIVVLYNDLYVADDLTDDLSPKERRNARRRLRHLQRQRKHENRLRTLENDAEVYGHPIELQPVTSSQEIPQSRNRNKDSQRPVSSNEHSTIRGNLHSTGGDSSRESIPPHRTLESITKERIRAKQLRLFQIQLEIHDRLKSRYGHSDPWDQGEIDPSEFLPFIPSLPDGAQGTRSFTPRIKHSSCEKPNRADASWYDRNEFRLYFEIKRGMIQNGDPNSNLTSAILKLYKRAYTSTEDTATRREGSDKESHTRSHRNDLLDDSLTVTVFQYIKAPRIEKSNRTDRKTIIVSQVVEKQHEGFIQLDIKKALRFWSENPRRNHGIVIKVEDSGGNFLNASQLFHAKNCSLPLESDREHSQSTNQPNTFPRSEPSTEPSLLVITEQLPLPAVRSKRDVTEEDTDRPRRKSRRRQCALTETVYTFEELGLDWILQPQTFTHRTCRGTCNRSPKRKSLRQRYGKHLDRFNEEIDEEEKFCCGPTAMAPLSVIHIDENSLIHYSILPDFIVTECGCRS